MHPALTRLLSFEPFSAPVPAGAVRPATPAEPAVPGHPVDGAAGPADDAPPRGCGFYDSTFDLARGLLVTEHASADAVANALPLEDWLSLWLATSPAGAGAARPWR